METSQIIEILLGVVGFFLVLLVFKLDKTIDKLNLLIASDLAKDIKIKQLEESDRKIDRQIEMINKRIDRIDTRRPATS